MGSGPVLVKDVLDGHVTLDVECLDRVYLNLYVPALQVPGQVVTFLTRHLGFPIPSPAVIEKIGTRFRRSVEEFAACRDVPVVRFGKGDRKIEVMRPYLDRQAATGRSGVAAIGVAQEFQVVTTAATRASRDGGLPQFSYGRAERRVTCYYFYVWDADFGPAFIKICAYSRIPARCGSTGTSGPSGRPASSGWHSRRCQTGSRRARNLRCCRRSVTGSDRERSACSWNGGGPGCRCR
jgi:hypothetical protein